MQPPAQTALVAVRGVGKRFGTTQALLDVSLDGHAGSVHAITGENGAGKSTLMKLLAGVHLPDSGEIRIGGRAVTLKTPAAARAAGVSTVFQELTVLPNLTVAENLLLGREPVRGGWLQRTRMRDEARAVLSRIGLDLDPDRACGRLTVGEQQLVEIAKGVSADASVFIFDEPTAPLNRAEVDKLEGLIRRLRADGKLVFYISHRLDEIFRLCDTVTVLKDGRHVATEPTAALTHERLIARMVGRSLATLFPPRAARSEASAAREVAALAVRSLVVAPGGPDNRLVLRRGEILGIGGLEGQGQREIVRALAGVLRPHRCDIARQPPATAAAADPPPARPFDPRRGVVHAVRDGVALIPADRKLEGLYLDLSIADNLWLGALRERGLMRRAPRDRRTVEGWAQRLQLRAAGLDQTVDQLSGGNQQKVMVGRWLASGVDTLLVEEPTRGVDVGAKAEIYALLRAFVAEGGAVLALSSDLPELIGLCDRILMVRAGRVVGEAAAETATEEGLLAMALLETTC